MTFFKYIASTVLRSESQRDFIHQPRVGAERLPWVIVQKIINPSGVAPPSHHDLKTKNAPLDAVERCAI